MTAAAVQQFGPMTAEQLFDLPDDGLRHELVSGELYSMAPAGAQHGSVAFDIGLAVGLHVREHRLGRCFAAETGFVLSRQPDTVRAPDLAFIRADRAQELERYARFAEVLPDLVVEVVSPYDRSSKTVEKALMWLDAGVRLVWVVDPQACVVTVYREDGVVALVRGPGALLDGGDVLPGLRIPLDELLPGPPATLEELEALGDQA